MEEPLTFKSDDYSVRIVDNADMKTLRYNGTIYSLYNKKGKYTDSYHDCFLPLPLLYEKASVLVIGLGGGTIPFNLKKMYGERVSIDVVESDGKMVEIAKRFLNVEQFDFNIIVDDGFSYVKNCSASYDIIILDAFVNESVPKQFLSTEFVKASHTKLTDRGMLAINYIPRLFFHHIYTRRLKNYFKVYKIKHYGNIVILCSKYFDGKYVSDKIREKLTSADDRQIIKFYSSI